MRKRAETRDRAGDFQIFSLTLSQLSYRGLDVVAVHKQKAKRKKRQRKHKDADTHAIQAPQHKRAKTKRQTAAAR